MRKHAIMYTQDEIQINCDYITGRYSRLLLYVYQLIEGNILTIYERQAKNRASGFVTKDKACKYMKQCTCIYKYIFHKHKYDMCISQELNG